MKLRADFLPRTPKTFYAILLCLVLVAPAATTQTNRAARAPGASPARLKAAVAETEIPQSSFVMPTSPRDGKDPFFPTSIRPYGIPTTTGRTNQPAVVVEVALKGISGTRERPLAIINNQTFAAGEEGIVVTGGRRVHIRCIEINPQTETVIVQIGNERRELRLKQPK